MQQGNLLIYP